MTTYRELFPLKPAGVTDGLVFDFAQDLAVGETISSATTTSTLYSGSDSSPGSVISGSTSTSGGLVTQGVKAGVAGNTYLITCTAITTSGDVLVRSGYLVVTA